VYIRPALFASLRLLATERCILSTVLIAIIATKNAEAVRAEPILGALRIETAIIPDPNTPVVLTIVAPFTVLVIDALFTFTGLLATVRCIFCAVLLISATFFADVDITIAVLRA
jgi:hypothetical protein